MRTEASEVGKWFGFSDVHPRVTHTMPRVCVPISMNPLTLVVGAELIENTNARERTFLFARACEIAKAGLSVALRSPPEQLAMVLAGLVHAYDPNYLPEGVDPVQLLARRGKSGVPFSTGTPPGYPPQAKPSGTRTSVG